jgi:hypothetical protein
MNRIKKIYVEETTHTRKHYATSQKGVPLISIGIVYNSSLDKLLKI